MNIQWLKYRKNKKGRDALGVQAINIHLYCLLVPGISNVTERLRYYSFYPWVLKIFRDEKIPLDFITFLRRSEFLFGLVTNFNHKSQDDYDGHVVGTITMNKALNELDEIGIIKLSKYTSVEESDLRYFKNKLGGFGQYYLGQLSQLGILSRKNENQYSLYPRGEQLADYFDINNIKNKFVGCVLKDEVSKQILIDFHDDLCVCSISKNDNEYNILSGILFDVDDPSERHPQYRRRNTLALLFSLLKLESEPADYWKLLNILYYEVDKDGQKFVIPSRLNDIARLWKYYMHHEYFSIGLSSVFVGVQHSLAIDFYTNTQITEYCWNSYVMNSDLSSFPKFISKCHNKLKENPLLEEFIYWLREHYDPKNSYEEDSLTEQNIANLIKGKNFPADLIFTCGLILILLSLVNEMVSLNNEPLSINTWPSFLGNIQ